MAGETTGFFTRAIEVMAVFSLMITLLIYALPAEDRVYVIDLRDDSGAYTDIRDVGGEFQSNIQQQKSFGVVEIGALALYSGNILIDLILNFFGAIPSMATIIMKGILIFMNLSDPIENALMTFTYAIVGIIYLISIITLLVNVRSGAAGAL
jgi:hypothetical protein